MHSQPTHQRSSHGRAILLGILLAAGATAAFLVVGYARPVPKRFAVVDEGVLYRCSQPSIAQLTNLRNDHAMETILIVRAGSSRRVPDEIEQARKLGMNIVHIEIDSRREITDDEVRQFFDCVDDPANQPVLIHCSAGRHRTGYLCALYRIERQGWSVEKALDEMKSFGGFDEDPPHVIEQQLRKYQSRSVANR